MPSQQANQLTRRHRAELLAVAATVRRGVRVIANRADLGDIDGWWRGAQDRVLPLVTAGWATSRTLGARYLEQHARIEGRAVAPVRATFSVERAMTSLRVTGPVAFKRSVATYGSPVAARSTMAKTLTASATRLTLAGERDTVAATAARSGEIVGWRRVTDEDPCFWCAMLASRGAVYDSRESAVGVVGRAGRPRGNRLLDETYHDGDECTAEPLYEDEDEPQSVIDLEQQWLDVTADSSGPEKIRVWRRYWDARQA